MAIFSLVRIFYIFCKHRLDELFEPLANKVLLSLLFFPKIFFRKRKEIEYRLSDALEEMGPLFIKFGQLLSTRPDLVGEKQARVLKKFQNNLKPFSTREAIKIVEQDLESPINQIFESFSEEPLAAASIAQVHEAILKDGESVVVKIVRPVKCMKNTNTLIYIFLIQFTFQKLSILKLLTIKDLLS